MSSSYRCTPLALALRALLLGLPLAASAAPADTAAEIREYRIPAGPLAGALTRFASEAGIRLSVDAALTDGRRSPGLSGSHGVASALAALLRGTGLEVVVQNNGSYGLRPAADTVLRPVQVKAATLEGGAGVYNAATTGFGRGNRSPREIPQAISSLTRQRLEDQSLRTLDRALDQATGITLEQSSSIYTGIFARGFEITTLQIDGGAAAYRGYGLAVLPDLVQCEQVDVLRGSDGLFSGTGEPGGAVNLQHKRPLAEPALAVALSAGRWDSYRTEVDASSPLAFDGRLRGRLVLAYEDRDSFQDYAAHDKRLGYGILEFEPRPGTVLSAGVSYEERSDPFVNFGLPRYSTGADLHLPRSTYLAAAWSRYDTRLNEHFLQWDQQLGERWTLSLDLLHTAQTSLRQGVGWASTIDPRTGAGGGATANRYEYTSDQYGVDLNIDGRFPAWGREHELTLGANWQKVESTSLGERAPGSHPIDDIFSFDPGSIPRPADGDYQPFFDYPNYGIRQQGVYGVVRLRLSEPLTLIAGGRYSEFDYEYAYRTLAGGAVTGNTLDRYRERDVFTPYGGLVYALNPEWNVYASVAETFQSQAHRLKGPLPGAPLDPITGRNYEVGLKGGLLEDRLDLYVALYRIERRGEAERDESYPVTPGELGAQCCWLDDGRITSQGLDAEISGEPLPGWWLSAGYTYNDNQNRREGGRYSRVTPRHLLKLFTTWQLPGAASAWRVGGGVNLQSASSATGQVVAVDANGDPTTTRIPFAFTEGGRAVWNAFAEYRIDSHWTAALQVANLFDKRYYSTVGNSAYYNFYGEPFNYTLTLRGRY